MTIQTDNSYLEEKVLLRLETVNLIQKDTINVLEAFAGDGFVWTEVRMRTDKQINILRIDQKKDKDGIYLIGDNIKYLKSMNFSKFDIVDLDAYGIPYQQLELIFNKKYKGYVHVTAIQSVMGNLPFGVFNTIGIPSEMYKKSITLFSKRGRDMIYKYLYKKGIKSINGYFIDRKNYFWFSLG